MERQSFTETLASLLPKGWTIGETTPAHVGFIPGHRSMFTPDSPYGGLKDMLKARHGLESTIKQAEGRNLDATEQSAMRTARAAIGDLTAEIEKVQAKNTSGIFAHGEVSEPQRAAMLKPLLDYVKFGTPIQATDDKWHTDTTGNNAIIPTNILDLLRAYTSSDPFALAGATIYQTDNIEPLRKPVILPGADPATFNEGATSTDSAPASIDSFTFNGTKYSRLVKVSEEMLLSTDVDLANEITSELGASVARAFSSAITSAMMSAFYTNSDTFVANGADALECVLNLIAALPPRWDGPGVCFMGSRESLKVLRNVRASTSGTPLFEPATSTILSRKYVVNDDLDRLVFGNFTAGAFIRKSPYFLQRLVEAYASTGEVGFRATQWLDQHFLAEIAEADQPLYYASLETEGS